MSTSRNSNNPLKKHADRFLRFALHFSQDMYHKIMVMDIYEKIFVIALLVFSFLIIISPLMILSPNDNTALSVQYIFLIGKVQLLKTTLVIFSGLALTIAWHLSLTIRTYIIEYIGFNNNRYLFSFLMLFATLASLMSLGEMNNLLSDYTTMLRMHTMYYVLQILLIMMVGYCIYMLLYQSQGGFKGTIVGNSHRNVSRQQDDDMQGLFDDLKDS